MKLVETRSNPIMTQVYHVDIMQHQDWFFATCEELPGLFVGHRDYEVVCKNLPEAIAMLLQHEQNEAMDVREAPAMVPRLLGHKVFTATSFKAAA